MHIHALDHVVLTVADVECSLSWYIDLVGMTPVRVDDWRNGQSPFPSVRINESTIIDLVAGTPSGVNMDHLCVVVDRTDIDQIAADDRFSVTAGPGVRYGARGNGWSVYVTDPDENTVEFRSYD